MIVVATCAPSTRGRTFRHSQHGMTLVEMLVVLAIIAITAAISLLALGAGDGLKGQAEAKRLAARLQFAADRTMLDDTQVAVAVSSDSFGFVEWDDERSRWQPSVALGQTFRLPSGMTLSGFEGRRLLPLGADTAGQGFSLVLTAGDQRWSIDFDGMTARLARPAATAGPVRSGT